jgi:hypothetical protein
VKSLNYFLNKKKIISGKDEDFDLQPKTLSKLAIMFRSFFLFFEAFHKFEFQEKIEQNGIRQMAVGLFT